MADRDEHNPAVDGEGRATIARLASEVVPTLIDRLTKSELGELEVRERGWRIRLRRPLDNAAAEPLRPAGRPAPQASHPPAHQAPREAPRGLVTSPGVGYFTPHTGVEAGSKLRSGDLVGHVDVLGVKHEVVAPSPGSLRAFDVQPGQAVEFGQPIARLDVEA